METLEETRARIGTPDREAERAAALRLDTLTKPQGSLGRLEEIVARYAAIRGDGGTRMGRGALLVYVADHGVADAGVSAYPQAVTVEMLRNIGAGGAAISVLARRFGYELVVTDVGVATDTSARPFAGVRYRRIAAGTRNMLEEPALSEAEARAALAVGIEQAEEAARRGVTLLGIGEMGIGNSTAAAALLAALTGIAPARLIGRGTGIDDAGLVRKVNAVEAALGRHREHLGNPLGALAAVGGLELAAMAGACLGGAAARVPVVVDGFIATAAAATAIGIAPRVADFLFFAHRSAEGGHGLALEALRVRPLLDLGMRLGEGTGAALAMNLVESALALFHQMATFASAGVSEKIG
ncbi:MAG TPA: nicotinate-nucleotide--dimethylbenzimidazole phosphoribosyltransferase [Candidatus Binataceae bacterium]|nr:nicotinate-nucleotide--dimethylbenzimidazole phosphoribosyltransferase [Candidatus Binataceae bacterium]